MSDKKKWAAAISSLSLLIEHEKSKGDIDPEYYIQRAELALKGQYYENIEHDIAEIEFKTENNQGHRNRILQIKTQIALRKSRYNEAYECSLGLVSQKIIPPMVLLLHAKSCYFLKRYRKALKYLQKILDEVADPELIHQAQLYKGIIHYNWGKIDQAFYCLEESLKQKNSDEALSYFALIQLRLGNYQSSLRSLKKIENKTVLVHEGFARYFLIKENYPEALKNTIMCLKAHPSRSKYHYLQGLILIKQQKIREAQQSFRKALSLNPSDLEPLMPLLESIFSNGDLNEVVAVPTLYSIYQNYFMMYEKQNLFYHYYNELESYYRQPLTKRAISEKERNTFLLRLETSLNPEVIKISTTALSSFFEDDKTVSIIRKKFFRERDLKQQSIWKNLLEKIDEKRQAAARRFIQKLTLRLFIGRDANALKEINKHPESAHLLLSTLESPQENLLIRLLACRTLLLMADNRVYHKINHLAKTANENLKLLCAVSLRERNCIVDETSIVQGLKSSSPFIRSLCVKNVDLKHLIALLEDPDERVKIHAAARIYKESLQYRWKCADILANAMDSHIPEVRAYAFSNLWPRRSQYHKTPSFPKAFIEKYQSTITKAIQDSNPKIQRLAASRIGSYRLVELRPFLEKLLSQDNEPMVRYQALISLCWIRDVPSSVIENIIANPQESLLLRSAAVFIPKKDLVQVLSRDLDDLISQNDNGVAYILMFMGRSRNPWGNVLIKRFLGSKNERIRFAASIGMLLKRSSDFDAEFKKLLNDNNAKIRSVAFAGLVKVSNTRNTGDWIEWHKKALKADPYVRKGASFGWFFPVYDDSMLSMVQDSINTEVSDQYDFYQSMDISDFFHQHFQLNYFYKLIQNKEKRKLYKFYLEQAIELFPLDVYHFKRAIIQQTEKNLLGAIRDLRYAIERNPKKMYLLHLQRALLVKGSYNEVIRIAEKITKDNPLNSEAWGNKALAYSRLKRMYEAFLAYEKAYICAANLKVKIRYGYFIAVHLFYAEQPERAIQYFRQCLMATSDIIMQKNILIFLARIQAKRGDYKAAIKILSQIDGRIQIFPEDVQHKEFVPLLEDLQRKFRENK